MEEGALVGYHGFMKLIVGLGNPGREFEKSRHNVGFMVVEKMAKSGWMKSKSGLNVYSWLGKEVELIKPQTFMNKSGEAVAYAVKKHGLKLDSVYVIHDDLDIKLGEYKIQFGKGPKVHNGINSVVEVLKTDQFYRVRIGVENRSGEVLRLPENSHIFRQAQDDKLSIDSLDSLSNKKKIPARVYVLQKFAENEKEIVDGVIEKVIKELLNVL